MKVVLDTNVLISGFKDEYSFEKRIIDEVLAGNIQAFANKQTLRENRLLTNKKIDNADYQEQLDDFFSHVTDVINRRRIKIVRDREDNKILESAVEAKADYLITSDNDLLRIKEYQDVQIVTPAEFWASYKDEGMDLWKRWTNYITKNR